MKKRRWIGLATLAVTLVVALGFAPRPALAEGGVTDGETLIDAFTNAPTDGAEQVIQLGDDVSTSDRVRVKAGSDIVLDLAGHTWRVDGSYIQLLGGSLTVQDSVGGGEIAGTPTGNSVISASNNGSSLRLEGGTITSSSADTVAVKLAASIGRGSLVFEMTGGAISAPRPLSLQLAAIVTISGGTITATGDEPAITIVSGSPSLTIGTADRYDTPRINGTISISDGKPAPTPTLNLVGGTIEGVSGAIPAGSTLTSHFTSEIPADSLPDGKECVEQDGTWIVRDVLTEKTAAAKVVRSDDTTILFETAASAASSLADGDTLVLLQDVSGQIAAKVSGSATIDLNGHSITSTDSYALSIDQGVHGSGTVTVKNSGAQASLTGARSGLYVTSSEFGDVTLDYQPANITLEPSAGGIELGNARMTDTAQNEALVTNGGFRTTVDGYPFIYGSVYAATKDVDDNTPIVLLGDYSGDESMRVYDPGTFVIDLNGYTYESTSDCAARVSWPNTSVTIRNGGISSASTSVDASIVGVYGNGGAAISNVALTLEDVDLSMEHSGNAGVIVQGLNTSNTVTLDGCTLTVPDDVMGIYFPPAESTLNVTDTQITAGTGIGVKGGTLNISGNTSIHATGANDPAGIPSTGGIAETGAAIYVDGGYVNRDVTVNVTGGTFASDLGSSVQELVDPNRPAENPVTIKVAAGSFSDDSMGSYLAGGVSVAARADGSFGVYDSEEDALANGGAYKVVDKNGHAWFFSTETAAKDFATNQAGDAAVEAIKHTVTFDSRVPNEQDVVVEVVHGQAVTAPADPELAGWTFVGWYTDATFTTRYDFSQPVTDDLALVAQWVEDKNPGGTTDEPSEPAEPTTPEPDKPAEPTTPEPTAPETEAEKDGGLAETGDAMLLAPLASSLAAGAAALGAGLVLRRRNR